MRKLFFGIAAAIVLLTPVQSVSAHELITDDTKTKGAIFHTMPDDDPIAGQQATLYFDTQGQLLTTSSAVKLRIEQPNGKSDEVAMTIDGSLATVTYTFPAEGGYQLIFTVTSGGSIYKFKQSQQVSGGTTDELGSPHYAWAEALLAASGISFAVLAATIFVRRKAIARQSKM